MSEKRAHVVTLTQRDIQTKINEILDCHPSLKDVTKSDYCCSGCLEHDIAGAFGYAATDAWRELEGLYFLLGDRK
jgi:hypothetical protein